MTSLNGTRIFRPSVKSIVVLLIAVAFLLGLFAVAIEMQVVPLAVGFGAFALAIGLGTVEAFRRPLTLTTNRGGVTYAGTTLSGTNFRFAWDDVASWHLDQSEDWFVQFDFVGSRKPVRIYPMWIGNPGLDEFLQEVRFWVPDREKLSQIESFRWKLVVTTGGAYLFAKGLNHDFFLWSEIRSWQVLSKSSEQDEGFIQFSFVGDRSPVKVGDAFVTLPTWERLLQTLRTHAGQQEVV